MALHANHDTTLALHANYDTTLALHANYDTTLALHANYDTTYAVNHRTYTMGFIIKKTKYFIAMEIINQHT